MDAAKEAVEFCVGQTQESMEVDRMRALAVTRCFEIIGEAAATVTPEFKAAYSSLPWRIMTGMRNRLVHAYFSIDLSIILETARQDLPPLITELEAVLAAEQEKGQR